MNLTDPRNVAEFIPCHKCRVTIGRKVSWSRPDGSRVVLCRACFYVAEADGRDVDTVLRFAGFTVEDTAGGCNAYVKHDDTGYVMITGFGMSGGEDATQIPETLCERVAVGWYDTDGMGVDFAEYPTVLAALAALNLTTTVPPGARFRALKDAVRAQLASEARTAGENEEPWIFIYGVTLDWPRASRIAAYLGIDI